ncbi:MAG: LEA type 2 family protein [Nitrososphaeria archaeon]
MRRAVFVLLFLAVILTLCYIGALYFSAVSAKISVKSIDLPQASNLLNALFSKQLSFDIYLNVEGHGVLDVPVRSLSGQMYLEGVYVGSVKSVDPFTIPASGKRTVRLTYELYLSSISLGDIQHIAQSISDHNGEVEIRFNGYAEPVILFFPITVPVSHNFYMLTISNAPKIVEMYWQTDSCEAGESADFTIVVKNVFRGNPVEGILDVIVREDVELGFDVDAKVYSFPIHLSPGESKKFTGTFATYKKGSTRGFFLKALWGGNVLAEQGDSYPPRLSIVTGSLSLVRAYWTVGGNVVASCKVGDPIIAHVIVKANKAAFQGSITVKVRKDIALGLDEDYKVARFDVSLKKDETKEYEIPFTPDTASSVTLRGYFIEIEGDLSWTMDNSYPPRLTVQVGGLPSVTNVWWTTSKGIVTEAIVGENVQAHVKIKALGGSVKGTITIHVRKDYPLLPDENYVSRSYEISLQENEETELTISFVPSEPTSLTFRGYFIQVELNTWGKTWTMDNSYPPRLTVRETPAGKPILQNVWWTVDGKIVTQVLQGQTVEAHVQIKAEGGNVQGTITIRIRKDLTLLPDEDYKVQTFTIDLQEGQIIDLTVTFIAMEKSSFTFRGYFMQVDFNTWGTSWTMEDSYPPRLKVN